MANVNENAVANATENTEKVGFFKKHWKKIAIGGGALLTVLGGCAVAKCVMDKTNAGDSDECSAESDESVE